MKQHCTGLSLKKLFSTQWLLKGTAAISASISASFILITNAFADAAPAAAASASGQPEAMGSNAMAQIMMLVAFGAIFYFLIWRPQNKRAKDHRNLVSGLQKGDEVLTSGGILGKVMKVTDDFMLISIAEGVEVVIQKQAVAAVMPKGTIKSI